MLKNIQKLSNGQGPSPVVQAKETERSPALDRLYRHTVGRFSMLARLPVYAAAIAMQVGKMVCKMPVAVFATPAGHIYKAVTGKEISGKLHRHLTFSAIARDGIMLGTLLDKTVNSAISILFAPPKQFREFEDAIITSYSVLSEDKYHTDPKDKTAIKVSDLFETATLARAQYHKQIIQTDSIAHKDLISPRAQEKVKAG